MVKFDSVINMQKLVEQSDASKFLDEGRHLFDGPATQQIIAGRHHENGDSLATVVVNFRVAPERSEAFLAFQHQLAASSGRYPGSGVRRCSAHRGRAGSLDGSLPASTTLSTLTNGWSPRTGGGYCAAASSVSFR